MDKTQNKEMLLDENTNFAVKEAYKATRTNIMFSTAHEGCKRIMLTSSYPEEGKTTTVANLGMTFAETGSKVLIIDCDLRKPKMHKAFGLSVKQGLADILGGFCEVDGTILPTNNEKLEVLPVGTIPPNPAELLGSERMSKLVEKLSESYDYILFDTPPINIVTDAAVLSKLASGTVLVVRHNVTKEQDVMDALHRLENANAKVMGAMLSVVKEQRGFGRRFSKYSTKYSYTNYEYKQN